MSKESKMRKFISNKYKVDKATPKITSNFVEDTVRLVDDYVLSLRKLQEEENAKYDIDGRKEGIKDEDLFENIHIYLNEAKDYIHYCLNKHLSSKKILFLKNCKNKKDFEEHLKKIQKKWRRRATPNLLGTNYSPLYVDFTKTPKQAVRDILEGKEQTNAKHPKRWTHGYKNEERNQNNENGNKSGKRARDDGIPLKGEHKNPPSLFPRSKRGKGSKSKPRSWVEEKPENYRSARSRSRTPPRSARRSKPSTARKSTSKSPRKYSRSRSRAGNVRADPLDCNEDPWMPKAYAKENKLIDEEPLFIPDLVIDTMSVPAFTVDRYNPEISGKLINLKKRCNKMFIRRRCI